MQHCARAAAEKLKTKPAQGTAGDSRLFLPTKEETQLVERKTSPQWKRKGSDKNKEG
jgi:hypothetical protein